MPTIDVNLTFEVETPGDLEDVLTRLHGTRPDTVDVFGIPESWVPEEFRTPGQAA